MAHKVAMKVRSDEHERKSIEKPHSATSKPKSLYTIVAALVAALMFGTALGVMISADTPTGFPTVIEPGSMVSGYSYVIFKDGTTYYAKNGTTGNIELSSVSASTVINTAITSIGPAGGRVLIRAGDYIFDTTGITISYSNIVIEGECQGTNWADSWGTRLIHEFNGNLIDINGTTTGRIWQPMIKNVVLWDENTFYTGYGINCVKTANAMMDNVNIQRFKSGGIFIRDSFGPIVQYSTLTGCGNMTTGAAGIRYAGEYATGDQCTVPLLRSVIWEPGSYLQGPDLYAYGIVDNIIVDNWFTEQNDGDSETSRFIFENCNGVLFTNGQCWNVQGKVLQIIAPAGSVKVSNNQIFGLEGTGIDAVWAISSYIAGNYISGEGSLVDSVGIIAGKYSEVNGNYVCNMGGPGIDVVNGEASVIGNTLVGNGATGYSWHNHTAVLIRWANATVTSNIFVCDATIQTGGIWLQEDADNSTVTGNVFKDATFPISCAASNCIIANNIGYVNEALGVATITSGTSIAFDHGLWTTPTLVLASFNSTGYGNYTWTGTTTQITITVFNSGTYTVYWYARF
jgi:hypothetical protein